MKMRPLGPVADDVAVAATTVIELRVGLVVRKQGRPRSAHDLLIAATARATHRTVVSGDSSAFADLPGVDFRAGTGHRRG